MLGLQWGLLQAFEAALNCWEWLMAQCMVWIKGRVEWQKGVSLLGTFALP